MIPTADELFTQAPEDAEIGACLICTKPIPLKRGTQAVSKHRADDASPAMCVGSHCASMKHDGRDETRRTAVLQRVILRAQIEDRRAEMIADLTTKNWDMAITVDYHAARIVPLETQHRLWSPVTVHGDLLIAMQEIIDVLVRGTAGALMLRNMADLVLRGHRDWLSAQRASLINVIEASPRVSETLTNLLFHI